MYLASLIPLGQEQTLLQRIRRTSSATESISMIKFPKELQV